jgi:S-disulfanyl-L-cysteine oxidoreductase SoxD
MTRVLLVALSLAAAAVAAAAQAPQTMTVWNGVYSNEQADRGGKVYERECARCHGDDLGGIEAAPALRGATFSETWNGLPLAELFDRVRTSMPQDKPGSLSRAETADVLAHMLRAGGFPAGEKTLAGDATALGQITFRTYRPE